MVISILSSISCGPNNNTPDPVNCFGAVACYQFNGNANDASGNSFNGTVHGATLDVGRNGDANGSYHFGGYKSGNPDYIELPTLQSMNNTEEISISMWIKVDVSIPTGNSPFTLMPDVPGDRLNAHVNYSPYTIFWDNGDIYGNGRVYVNQTNSYSWDHFVFIKSATGNKMQVYKNNVLIIDASKHDDITDKNRSIRLGGGAGGDQYFAGWMDDVRIYKKALSASEVTALFNE